MTRVFLSHSSKDKPFVRELFRRLTRDGVSCFFDEESIAWGDNWVLALEKGIDTCKHLVVVLSPDFLASKWAQIERTAAMADDPDGLRRKILPLMLAQCRNDSSFPRFLRPIQAIDVSNLAFFEKQYPRICREVGGTPGKDIEPPHDRTVLPPVVDLPSDSWMPHRSLGDRFVGRIEALWELHDRLSAGMTAVVQGVGLVTGTGGLGKTQLAIEYVHRFAVDYPGGVFWIEADQGLPRLIAIVAEAASIEVDGKMPLADQLQVVWRGLNRATASLVILDNFPETDPLQPWLPPSGPIHLLVTTRRRDLTRYPAIGLRVLSPDESVQLLTSDQRRPETEEVRQLAAEVGGLPLALELLRGYLDSRTDVTPAMVLEEFAGGEAVAFLEEFAREYRDELPTGHEKGVIKTFELSWALASEPAKRVLAVMALLAPTGMPRRLLRAVLEIPETTPLRNPLQKSLAELRRLSLVDFGVADDPFAHRLIMGFVRQRGVIDKSLREATVESVRREMKRSEDENDTKNLKELEPIFPHAVELLHGEALPDETDIELATAIGKHHLNYGRPNLAHSFYEAALRRSERAYPPGHSIIAKSQSNLATVLRDLGQPEKARDLLRSALASNEQSYARGHPSIATCQSDLATVLIELDEGEEARDLLRAALASDEQNYSPGHPRIAADQAILGMALAELGELEEACELLRSALTSVEQNFVPGHPRIAKSQSNLAAVLRKLGGLEEARDLLRAALASDEQKYTPDHPRIAIRQLNLALVLKDLGEMDEARELLRNSHNSLLQKFGSEYTRTRIAKRELDSLG